MDDLDSLAAKADALKAMKDRNDPRYGEALKIYKMELETWKNDLTNKVLLELGIKV